MIHGVSRLLDVGLARQVLSGSLTTSGTWLNGLPQVPKTWLQHVHNLMGKIHCPDVGKVSYNLLCLQKYTSVYSFDCAANFQSRWYSCLVFCLWWCNVRMIQGMRLLCLVITLLVQGLSCCCILLTVTVTDCTATSAHYQQVLQQTSWHIHIMWQRSLCLWFTDILSAERCQTSVHIATLPYLGSEVISASISFTCMKLSLFYQHLYLCATPGQAECAGFLLLPQKEVGDLLIWL